MSIEDPKMEVPSEPLSFSENLTRLRKDKGLTVEQVAEFLRIGESYIQAMERGDFNSLPESAFVRGYLRNYSRLLECDADELVLSFDRAIGEDGKQAPSLKEGSDEPMTLRAHRTPSAAMGVGLLVAVLVGGLGYFGVGAFRSSSEPVNLTGTSDSFDTELPEAAMPADFDQEFVPSPEPEAPASELSAAEEESEEESAISETVSEAQPEAFNEEPQQRGTPEVVNAEMQMVVRFREDCWIEIKDASDRILISEVGKSGSRITLDVIPPVQVRMGNAPGVEEITLNGEPVTISSGRRVASLVIDPVRG